MDSAAKKDVIRVGRWRDDWGLMRRLLKLRLTEWVLSINEGRMGKSDQVLISFPFPPSGKVIEKSLNNSGIYLIAFIYNVFFSGNHGLTWEYCSR